MSNKITNEIRELPIYRDGLAAGEDIAFAVALSAITAERIYQEQMAADESTSQPGCHAVADGALLRVAKVLAGRFRR